MDIAEFVQAKRAEIFRDHERETAYRLGVAAMKAAKKQGKNEETGGMHQTTFVSREGDKSRAPVAIRELGANLILVVKINKHNTASYARVRPSGWDKHIEYPVEPESPAEADKEVVGAFADVARAMGVDVDALEPVLASDSAKITDSLDIFE